MSKLVDWFSPSKLIKNLKPCYNGQGTIVKQGVLTSILHRNGGGAHEEKQIEF